MRISDRIGLLPGFGWMSNISTGNSTLDWFLIYLIFLAIVPFGLWFVQLVIMGDPVSLRLKDNYLSFIIGDWFLAIAGANMLLIGRLLPPEPHWYNGRLIHWCVFVFAFLFALFMSWLDMHGGGYTPQTMLYPPKLYHNIFAYWIYVYVLLSSFIAAFSAAKTTSWWVLFVSGLIAFAVWGVTVKLDSSFASAVTAEELSVAVTKADAMVPQDWRFFNGPRRWLENYYAVPMT